MDQDEAEVEQPAAELDLEKDVKSEHQSDDKLLSALAAKEDGPECKLEAVSDDNARSVLK